MGTSGRIKMLLMLVLCYIFLNSCIQASASIVKGFKFKHVDISQSRSPGDAAELLCDYDLGNEDIYSIKWYKDGEEFYRFIPKAQPQASSYKTEGIDVDISVSNGKKVVLKNVEVKTSGLFRCEVSLEAPTFATIEAEGQLKVESPSLSGLKLVHVDIPSHSSPGENVELLCDYKLGDDVLYGIKWYRYGQEFYRFILKAKPQASVFKLEGIDVDMNLSDSKRVILKNVGVKTSGIFRCEVFADAPSFASVFAEKQLEVLSSGLELVRVTVPQHHSPGEKAELFCDYNMGGEVLYSVKWYKDGHEFYRFIPKEQPQVVSFKMEGVNVNFSMSDSKKLVLENVSVNTSGVYRCEVSADAPAFTTVQGEARMEVVSSASMPVGLKLMHVGVPEHRSPGEIAELVCEYELGNDTLYSVKWYKGIWEFYRFTPKAVPQTMIFKVEGVNVDMSLSNGKKVILNNVNSKTSGLYTCEVAAEPPTFSIVKGEARLKVT